jgi:hypothetical protein
MVKFGFLSNDNQLQSFKTSDDVIFQVEKLEAGKSINKINEAFEVSAIEDGTYRLKDNFEIEVKEGKISSVREIFVDATLEDGTAIKIEGDVIDLGAKVSVVQGDAEVPAPDGVHTLDNGDKITTVDGVITEFYDNPSADEETEKAPEAPSLEAANVDSPEIDKEEKVTEKDELVSMLKDFIGAISTKLSQMETEQANFKKELANFAKQPASKKIIDAKTDFNKVDDAANERLNAVLAIKNSINK